MVSANHCRGQRRFSQAFLKTYRRKCSRPPRFANIRPSDHGIVVCQWELDSERSLFDGGDAPQYLTEVFYERDKTAESSGDGAAGPIRRLFFAAMVSDDEPQLTLERLPLFVESPGAPMNRRTMKGFKREWQSLRQQYPDRDVFVTDRHHEWTGQLKSRGIDPQLFSYQLLMNRQEGGASALFSFNVDEDLVDFLLQMALDEQFAQQVRDQMGVTGLPLYATRTQKSGQSPFSTPLFFPTARRTAHGVCLLLAGGGR